jgi:hypothetical protein
MATTTTRQQLLIAGEWTDARTERRQATGPAQHDNRGRTGSPCQIVHAPHARHDTVMAQRVECQVLHAHGAPPIVSIAALARGSLTT